MSTLWHARIQSNTSIRQTPTDETFTTGPSMTLKHGRLSCMNADWVYSHTCRLSHAIHVISNFYLFESQVSLKKGPNLTEIGGTCSLSQLLSKQIGTTTWQWLCLLSFVICSSNSLIINVDCHMCHKQKILAKQFIFSLAELFI